MADNVNISILTYFTILRMLYPTKFSEDNFNKNVQENEVWRIRTSAQSIL